MILGSYMMPWSYMCSVCAVSVWAGVCEHDGHGVRDARSVRVSDEVCVRGYCECVWRWNVLCCCACDGYFAART